MIDGVWKGVLDIGGSQLEVFFHIESEKDLKASISIPAKNLILRADLIEEEQDHLEMIFSEVNGRYEGKLDGDIIEGKWDQKGYTSSLTLHRYEGEGLRRPQHPTPPFPYDQEEVRLDNRKDGVSLEGTLTLPWGEGPFPAVHLITGSGAHDRDETVFGHKPFLVIADYLTRKGIAVLRMDDRGIGGSSGKPGEATSFQLASDVEVGIEYLRQREDIDPHRIGLIGHSEGGFIASIVASRREDLAFMVMLAGPGLKGEEILLRQPASIGKALGHSEDLLAWNRMTQKRLFRTVRESDPEELEENARKILLQAANEIDEEMKGELGMDENWLESQIAAVKSPWFKYYLSSDPIPFIKKVKCPVLAIAGEKDLQVTPKENLEAIGEALSAGGNRDYETVELPNINHILQSAETGLPQEYGQIEETVAPIVLEKVTSWILERIL